MQDRRAQEQSSIFQGYWVVGLSLGGSLLVLLLGLSILMPIRRSLSAMRIALEDLVQGDADLTKRLPAHGRDEFSTMASLFNQFLAQQAELIRAVRAKTHGVSEHAEPLTETGRAMEQTAQAVDQKAQGVAAAVEQASHSLNEISQGAHRMEETISMVASAMEEMSASLSLTERRCGEEVQATSEGSALARNARDTITRLDRSAQEIGSVVDTIQSIAQQTNLLALNATIEAATAGEAGKGFAVVASEVKELARQTAAATEGISAQAHAMRTATTDTIQALEAIQAVIQRIVSSSLAIQQSVQEQTQTVHEVSRSGANASQAAQGIARHVQESAQGLQEIARTAGGLERDASVAQKGVQSVRQAADWMASATKELMGLVGRFKL